ncbi:MAG TPA: class E sortase [Acidimicrobiales bacterium]|nr:class E sortase [Acidimicrobiales bacterium]
MEAVFQFFRRNRLAYQGLSVLLLVLVISAVGLLGFPVYTNFEQGRIQDKKAKEFTTQALKQKYEDRQVKEGDPITRIRIQKIGVDVVVVEGTTPAALKAGAGHYRGTPLPCEMGNVAIAGHRTTYGKPFNQLDRLAPGDKIELTTPVGSCEYVVTDRGASPNPFVVDPSNISIVANTPGERNLTLTTCNPKGSARQRLVIRAHLVSGAQDA